MLYRMAALKLLMSESCFRNVVLHIFLGNYKLFLANQFHRNTSERLIRKSVHLFKSNQYCFGRATVEV